MKKSLRTLPARCAVWIAAPTQGAIGANLPSGSFHRGNEIRASGKVLEAEPFHAEFFVQPDKKVSITFYDESMKPVAPEEQIVKVIAEAPSGKATLDFEKTGDAFVSTELCEKQTELLTRPDYYSRRFQFLGGSRLHHRVPP